MKRPTFADALALMLVSHPITTLTITLDAASARQLVRDLRDVQTLRKPDHYDRISIRAEHE